MLPQMSAFSRSSDILQLNFNFITIELQGLVSLGGTGRDDISMQFAYDRVHVNGSACGHLNQKLITHSFMSDMSLEPQGNVVYENI